MKIKMFETNYVFGFDLEAETLQEAAWISRFQTNVKKEIPHFGASVDKEGAFIQYVYFDRKKEITSSIKK